MTIATAPTPATVRAWPQTLTGTALAVAALVVTLTLLRHGGLVPAQPWSGHLDPPGVLLAAASSLPLAVAWRFPLTVFVGTATASAVLAGFGYPADVIIGPAVALYLLVARRRDTRLSSHTIAAIAAGGFAVYLAAAAIGRHAWPGVELLHTGLAWGAAWFAGERTRLRREQIGALHDRALRAEQDSERDRQLAVAEERARIARDLHDSAGHAINVIAVRAGAARLNHHQHPERSLTALTDIETLARHTAAQIDHIVGGLRDRDHLENAVPVPPGVASLGTLVAQHTATGLAVTHRATGIPPPPGSPADQAIYRTIQEGLTNAARHGTGIVEVTAKFGATAAHITITNPVRGMATGNRNSGGHGLIGMRERITLLGGTLHTSHANGQFRLQATIPTLGSRL